VQAVTRVNAEQALYGAFEVKHLFHGILHFLHSIFFVRLGIPFFLRPAVLQSRRAQELSRLAVGNLCSLTLRDISCCCDELGTDLCLLPQPEGDWNGIDVELLPPCRFVTRTMELAVMEPTNRNEKLVAYGAPKCTWLRKPER
jgi:hypothetical protein